VAEVLSSRVWAACNIAIAGAQRRSGNQTAVEEVMACGGAAEIAEDEILGHAVVKLSHEWLLLKEN
jgi:hypothetical protein